MTHVVETRGLDAGYGAVPIVRGLDMHADAGQVVALLGPNGAGKTTVLLTVAGALAPLGGEVVIAGRTVTDSLHKRAARGMALVSDDRAVFRELTVAENLRLGDGDPEDAIRLFPALDRLRQRKAGLLSGGEQQMLGLGRALARKPEILLADELSLGLAPIIVRSLLAAVRAAVDAGTTVLLVEQHVRLVLPICDYGYVLQRGRVQLEGTASELLRNLDVVESTYLSATG